MQTNKLLFQEKSPCPFQYKIVQHSPKLDQHSTYYKLALSRKGTSAYTNIVELYFICTFLPPVFSHTWLC